MNTTATKKADQQVGTPTPGDFDKTMTASVKQSFIYSLSFVLLQCLLFALYL